ncbi:hypothetical protein Esti_000952 [Eimeria stiedai]
MAPHTGSGRKSDPPCCPQDAEALKPLQEPQQEQQQLQQQHCTSPSGFSGIVEDEKESEWEAQADAHPLVGSLLPLDVLIPEFISGSNAHKKIKFLCSRNQRQQQQQQQKQQQEEGGCAAKVRRVRRDGCCFYRSYMFGVFEKIVGDAAAVRSLKDKLQQELIPRMLDTGIRLWGLGFCGAEMQEALDLLEKPESSVADVERLLNETGPSNYLVVFARLLTAAELRSKAESFLPFLSNHSSIDAFCLTEVEPMWVGAEQPQILALASALSFPVEIVYVDQSKGEQPARHIFPDSTFSSVKLLYRPGHYDLLYEY